LGSRLYVFGLSTPRQCTTKLDLHKFTLQQTLTTMEMGEESTNGELFI
jgi:hypothetical protein